MKMSAEFLMPVLRLVFCHCNCGEVKSVPLMTVSPARPWAMWM